MECKIKTDIGTIYISEDVMLKVVGYAALECYGIVAMSSRRAKDGLVEPFHHRGIRHLHRGGLQNHRGDRPLQAGEHDRREGSQSEYFGGRDPRLIHRPM